MTDPFSPVVQIPPQPKGRQQAVALGYDPQQDVAPRVLASGQGVIAEQIIALARGSGIPIYEDDALAAVLAKVQLDTAIPPELYALVAEVFVYVMRVSNAVASSSVASNTVE